MNKADEKQNSFPNIGQLVYVERILLNKKQTRDRNVMPSGSVFDYVDNEKCNSANCSTIVETVIGNANGKLASPGNSQIPTPNSVSRDTSPVDGVRGTGTDANHSETWSTADELARIRDGFDLWLAAFRRTRPQRDVIWRVGEPIKSFSQLFVLPSSFVCL